MVSRIENRKVYVLEFDWNELIALKEILRLAKVHCNNPDDDQWISERLENLNKIQS